MSSVFKELVLAIRGLRKSPGLAILAVVTLAMGIGMNALMFGIVYGALFRGVPFPDGHRIVRVWGANPSQGQERMSVSIHDYTDWVEQQTAIEDLAAGYAGTINVSGLDRPIRLDGAFVTPNAFSSLRVEPVLGRTFQAGEELPDAPRVAILGWQLWQDRFGGTDDVLGTVLRVNGEPTTVIGVMPKGFMFPEVEEIWVPLRLDPLELERGAGQGLMVWGRLGGQVTVEEATTQYAGIAQRLAQAYPETNEGVTAYVEGFTEAAMGGGAGVIFFTMLATTLLVLLVACANVANLLLARAAGRTKELAINVSLGASQARVVGKLVAEAVVLVIVGSALGAVLGKVGLDYVVRVASVDNPPPFWFDFSFDAPILLFVVGVASLSALVAGLIPGLRVRATRVHEILKDESRGSSSLKVGRLSRALVITELAFSVGLLVAAGLMVRGMLNLRTLDFDFRTAEVFTARIGLFESAYATPEERWEFYRELRDRLEARPEIRSAALTSALPGLFGERTAIGIQGAAYESDQDYPLTRFAAISPGFFETVGVEVQAGRDFTDDDDANALPVAVVNRSFTQQYFSGEDPLGRQIRMGTAESQEPWLTIVGVVPDMYLQGVGNEDPSQSGFYVPLAQADRRFVSIAAVGPPVPLSLTSVVQDEVGRLNADTPLYWVRTLERGIRLNNWQVDIFGGLFAVFGLLALLLAAAGLYAVMATGVAQRTREMGVRMALGAGSPQVLGMVLRQGALQLAMGLGLGFLLAAGLSRGLRVALFGVEPWDPTVFAAIAVIMLISGLAASLLPALRATRVDPVEALRSE